MDAALAADALVVLHAAFVAFVALGGLAVWRWPRLAYLHMPAAIWGVWIEVSGRICPLTPLENRLRAEAGRAAYEGGFIERYLLPVLYPDDLTREVQIALGVGAFLLNAVLYGLFIWKVRRRRR